MPEIEIKRINVGGLWANLFTKDNNSNLPVAILFVLHGRGENSQKYEPLVRRVLDQISHFSKENANAKRDLVIVTFDQRNHGTRLLDMHANLAWDLSDSQKHNATHAVDMYAIQNGTARDVSFMMDFLPSYLYPNGERKVVEFAVSGISLGGHATWIALKQEPRLKVGIPIIGCPDYARLLEIRARQSSINFGPPYFPDTLRAHIGRHDPAAAPVSLTDAANPFHEKKILVLSGGKDKLVPWEASAETVDKLNVGTAGIKKVVIDEDAAHEVSEKMKAELCQFIWDHVVT